MNTSPLLLDPDLQPANFIPPKPSSRNRMRMLSDHGAGDHSGLIWDSDDLRSRPHARASSSSITRSPIVIYDTRSDPRRGSRRDSINSTSYRDSYYDDDDLDYRVRRSHSRRRRDRSITRERSLTRDRSIRSPSPSDLETRRERRIMLDEFKHRELEMKLDLERRQLELERKERNMMRVYERQKELEEMNEREIMRAIERQKKQEIEILFEEQLRLKKLKDEKSSMAMAEPSVNADAETGKNHELSDTNQKETEQQKIVKELEQKLLLERIEKEVEAVRHKKALEEFIKAEEEKDRKAKEAREEVERLFEERLRAEFQKVGYSGEHIDQILQQEKDKRTKEEEQRSSSTSIRKRPKHIKVHRKYLLPETLDEYSLPWEYDPEDANYIIIKRWIEEPLQEEIFKHTRKIKERAVLGLDANDSELTKRADNVIVIRQKSPSASKSSSRSWMLT